MNQRVEDLPITWNSSARAHLQLEYKERVSTAMVELIKRATSKNHLVEFAQMLSEGCLEESLDKRLHIAVYLMDPKEIATQIWKDTAAEWKQGKHTMQCKSAWWARLISQWLWNRCVRELIPIIEKL